MKTFALGLVSIASLLLLGCGSAAPAATPIPSKLQTVSLGVVSPSASHAPLLVALKKGYFKEAGLQIDYQQFGNGELASAGLAAGHLEVAVTVPTIALFNEIDRGLD